MELEAKRYLDKNGQEFILRSAEISDAADLLRYLRITAEETPYLIREPEETSLSENQERAFVQGLIKAERECMLVAAADNKIVGTCSLMKLGDFRRFMGMN